VQAQDLDIGNEKPGALDRRQHFGQGRNVAAGKDVFRDPGIGDAGTCADKLAVAIAKPHSMMVRLRRRMFSLVGRYRQAGAPSAQ
jgi:hypothetical protein